jgi:hypothetical protein
MAELKLLEEWCKRHVNTSRPKGCSMLASYTWVGVQGEILRYMGFLHMYKGVEQPTLQHYLNGWLLMDFLSFLQLRGVKPHCTTDG